MRQDSLLGATYLGQGRCQFLVWAPFAQTVAVHLITPQERIVPLAGGERGYHQAVAEGVEPGTLYRYRLNDQQERPDPASRFQPQDVHGPSQVTAHDFPWTDHHWCGLSLKDYVLYELHVGTFTSEGTFAAVVPRLAELKDLGITAIELMPVAQYPGSRNWGYDGVYPFAVQASYGGPPGLKTLVNACHQQGLAVVLDVVYNHLGPEGNYLGEFGHYFTDRYKTPWGLAMNYDGVHSDEVRRFFIENALYWITAFHIDALRLDAVHAIFDHSACPFLEELGAAVHERADRLGRRVYTIAESDLDDVRVVRLRELGGFGLEGQWNDDFHHALRGLLTGDRNGYYQDFGQIAHLVKAFREGYVYSGEYSLHRQRRHGTSSRAIAAHRFVVFAQNHDQVGNRMLGERLSQLTSFEGLKLAAGIVLLSPFLPLLFMGEEYGETAPFQYFISHTDPALIEAVRTGRREEFAAFRWQGEAPDPQDEATFQRCKLDHALRHQGHHKILLDFYTVLLQLRREVPALAHLSKDSLDIVGYEKEKVIFIRRWHGHSAVCILASFNTTPVSLALPIPPGRWTRLVDSAEERWQGRGSALPVQLESDGALTLILNPRTFGLFMREDR